MTNLPFPIDPFADREGDAERPTLAQETGDDPVADEFADQATEESGDDGLEPQAQVPPL